MKTHIHKSSILLSLLTVLLIGGCSGEDGKDGKDCTLPVSDDTTPPTVLSVTPADGGNEVDERTILTVTFDEAMDKESMNSATFRLMQGTTLLPGTVESSRNSAVFKPEQTLEQGEIYSAVITTDAQDLAGNPLQTAYNWSFTTQSDQDLTPPTVVLTDPQDGHEVPYLTAQLSAYFSEEMDAATINTDTFTLENPRGKVAGSVSYSTNKATLDITDQRLDLNSRYTATITDYAQDSSGLRMAQEYSWKFITLDGSWNGTTLIESIYRASAPYPHIAVDSKGNAIAVWQQYDGSRYNIWANRFDTLSRNWQGAILIETDNTGSAHNPQIAVDKNGNAIVVWYQYDGSRYNILANYFDVLSGNWQGSVLIENDNAGSASSPQIAVNSSGNAVAVWYQSDGTRYNIWANYFDPLTGNWQGAVLIESDEGTADNPKIAINDSGNAVAIWWQYIDSRRSIYTNYFNTTTGHWQSSPTLIEHDNTGDADSPQITMTNSGDAIAVWRQFDGIEYSIYTNSFNASTGSWNNSPTLLEHDDANYAFYPKIALDRSGNAITVWYQSDGTRYNIWANRFDAINNRWQSTPTLLEHDNTDDARSPDITMDSSGNAIVLWYQSDGIRYNILANRFDAITNSWQSTPTLLEHDNTGDAKSPDIAMDSNGNAIAIWWHDDGSRYNIYANYFE